MLFTSTILLKLALNVIFYTLGSRIIRYPLQSYCEKIVCGARQSNQYTDASRGLGSRRTGIPRHNFGDFAAKSFHAIFSRGSHSWYRI